MPRILDLYIILTRRYFRGGIQSGLGPLALGHIVTNCAVNGGFGIARRERDERILSKAKNERMK